MHDLTSYTNTVKFQMLRAAVLWQSHSFAYWPRHCAPFLTTSLEISSRVQWCAMLSPRCCSDVTRLTGDNTYQRLVTPDYRLAVSLLHNVKQNCRQVAATFSRTSALD